MTFDELKEFLTSRMRMSHLYQPLLIRSLVESGGMATVRQLAAEFVLKDEGQLKYYEERVKDMPVRVLSGHGIVTREGDLVRLNVPRLDVRQRAEIRRICEEKICQYVERKGLGVWDYRMLDFSAISDGLRYQILKDGGGRCALCGATAKDSPLDVDHIIPRSRGGGTEAANLQVLCAKCNRTKGDRDDTDFRPWPPPERDGACPFCDGRLKTVEETRLAVVLEDGHPVTPGHALILPKRHTPDFFSLTAEENAEVFDLLRVVQRRLRERDRLIAGFNVGSNAGAAAGQTVMHCHVHLIPRRTGDAPDPEGGVRGVIPGRAKYRRS